MCVTTLVGLLLISSTIVRSGISWGTQEEEKSSLQLRKEEESVHRRAIIEALETGQRKNDELFHRQLTRALLRNITTRMSDSDLCLWITAVIARKENPRDVNGINLINDLIARVDREAWPRPFNVLTLCNAQAVTREYLKKLLRYNVYFANSSYSTRGVEVEALALKTLACAQSLSNSRAQKLDEFTLEMTEMAERLKSAQTDGYFENIYTTSVVCQALTAYNLVVDPTFEWGEKQVLEYLRKQSSTSGGITKAYYICLALNARRVPFLRNLNEQSYATSMTVRKHNHVVLSIRNQENRDVDFSMTLRVPGTWDLFQVMTTAAEFSYKFKFNWTKNKMSEPVIIEVDGTPNDPEKGLYWMVCSSTPERLPGFYATPTKFIPHDGENVTLWYRTTDCPP